MDSKLRGQVLSIIAVLILGVVSIVIVANWRTIKRRWIKETPVSVETEVREEIASVEETSVRNNFVGDDPYSWMSDSTFFNDGEDESVAKRVSREMNTLTISVNSVYKDLRVSIYGYGNVLFSGEAFEINLKEVNNPLNAVTYKDTDKDGVIYIGNLEPVEYSVNLVPMTGYVVPDNSTKITVKGELSYEKISDINLIINDESEVVSRMEDTRVYSASAMGSIDRIDDMSVKEYAAYGIDVSSKDESIDFKELYDSGIRFVMLRAGYRGAKSGAIVKDTAFDDNAAMAKRAGLDVGAYFFSQAVSEIEAVEEASALIKICEGAYVNYPLAIVVDSAGGIGRADGLSSDRRNQYAIAFAKTVKNSGYESMIYESAAWLNDNENAKSLEKFGIWLGDYNEIPTYEGLYDFWQYTDTGELSTIDGNRIITVDLRKQ